MPVIDLRFLLPLEPFELELTFGDADDGVMEVVVERTGVEKCGEDDEADDDGAGEGPGGQGAEASDEVGTGSTSIADAAFVPVVVSVEV